MAVTGAGDRKYYRLPEEQYPQQGYKGLAGVSNNTAQQAQQAQQAYQPNQQAQQAQQQLQNVQAQKPQSYNSKYAPQLDNILNQIQNPQEFKYSFDGDELFKYYADLYTQKGKQAAQDTMGQAAALTGGYGNSYGQLAANQAYDQYLLSLYDRGMDLRDRAYQQHRDQQGDMLNQYNILAQQDATDYGRYRDAMGDWEGERDYWTGRADTEEDRGYQQYVQNRDYWTQMAGAENQDWWNAQNQDLAERQFAENTRQFDEQLAENIRQFDAGLDFEKMTNDQKQAAQYALAILQNGQMPSLELLKAAGLSEEDAQKLMAQLTTGGGGSGKGGKNVFYVDKDYNLYRQENDGSYTQVDPSEIKPGDYYNDALMGNISLAQKANALNEQVENRNANVKGLVSQIGSSILNNLDTGKAKVASTASGVKVNRKKNGSNK